jgi:hypothetical protein
VGSTAVLGAVEKNESLHFSEIEIRFLGHLTRSVVMPNRYRISVISHTAKILLHGIKKSSCSSIYQSVQSLSSSRLLSKTVKIKIYKTIIFPVVLYGCETLSLTLREEHLRTGQRSRYSDWLRAG